MHKTYTHWVVHDEESLTPGGTSEIHMWRGVAAVGVVDRPPADESLERCTGQDVASKLKARVYLLELSSPDHTLQA